LGQGLEIGVRGISLCCDVSAIANTDVAGYLMAVRAVEQSVTAVTFKGDFSDVETTGCPLDRGSR
jgi:hypothetical protein